MPPHEEEQEEEQEQEQEQEQQQQQDNINVDNTVETNNEDGDDINKDLTAAAAAAADLESFLQLVAEKDPGLATRLTNHAYTASLVVGNSTWTAPTPPCPLYQHVTKLNLTNCGLTELPNGFETTFPHVSILFLSHNHFVELPAVIGKCPHLQMVAFKSNGMQRIHPEALQSQLRWLILTNNALTQLPDTMGRCVKLQKCMLSGNRLMALPDSMERCTALELIRLASNQLTSPPWPILKLPNLKWMGLSENPFLTTNNNHHNNPITSPLPVITTLDDNDDSQGEILGKGAGGVTRKVLFGNHHDQLYHEYVAVKQFNCTAMTSDGNPAAERDMASRTAILHLPALIQTLGQTPQGSLVMEYLENYTVLADPPSMQSCSRDVYNNNNKLDDPDDDTKTTTSTTTTTMRNSAIIRGWDFVTAEHVVTVLLETLVTLHQAGLTHGDLYGHNLLVTSSSSHEDDNTNTTTTTSTSTSKVRIKLSDFGAAYAYDRTAPYAPYVEAAEVRALGVLVQEINEHVVQQPSILLDKLVQACNTTTTTTQTFDHVWIAWRKWQLSAMAKAFDPDVEDDDDDEKKDNTE
eukprot:scaffold8690_cov190-Amphora_coffeaeformis.AAC.17